MLGFRIFGTLAANMLDSLGDLNPQLLRELKGRLQWGPILTATGLSLLIQLVVIVALALALPGNVAEADLQITTYPNLTWDNLYSLDSEIEEAWTSSSFFDLGREERKAIRESGYVTAVDIFEPLRGDRTAGLDALEQIQVGDRLLEINNSAVPQPFVSYPNTINTKIVGYNPDGPSPDLQRLVGTRVALTFQRPSLDEYTVTLPRVATAFKTHKYCLLSEDEPIRCHLVPDQQSYRVNWPKWYGDLFTILTSAIVFPLMGVGAFLLASNLAEENRHGTLDLLRMSPRSAVTALLGKLVGVPVCLYLAIALVLPLHWFIGLSAGYGAGHLLGFNLALIGQTLIFYLLALLLSLATTQATLLVLQPWLLAAAVTLLNGRFLYLILSPNCSALSCWSFPHNADPSPLLWTVFFSPLISFAYFIQHEPLAHAQGNTDIALGLFQVNFATYTSLTVIHALGWCSVLGHLIQRRYSNSQTTLLKRMYSYGLTTVFMVIVLGLANPDVKTYQTNVAIIACFGLLYGIVLAIALSPNPQTLQDWARFRSAQSLRSQQLPLWKDLTLGDTSSPVVAIALNLLLAASLFMAWLLYFHWDLVNTEFTPLSLAGSVLLFVGSVLFAVLVSQVLLMSKRRRNWIWLCLTSSVSCLVFPGLTLLISNMLFKFHPQLAQGFGLASDIVILAVPLSLLGAVTTVLTFVYVRQLILVGRSESQPLFNTRL
ncbi:MAG: hypothetical protein AAFW84_12995 [Cyanobacteria bacterium J06635_15]